MENEQLLDPQLWRDRLLDDPWTAMCSAYQALASLGFLDVSALWRQFYDDSVSRYDLLHWHSLATYAIVCGAVYFLLVDKGRVVVSATSFVRFLLPREITASRSFRIDIQYYILLLLKLPQLMKIGGLILLASLQVRLESLHLHELPVLHEVSNAIAQLPRGWGDVVIFAVALLSYELGFYWAHRWAHQSKLLWQFHKVHHYSTQLNPLTGVRHHPFDALVLEGIASLTMVLAISLIFDFSGRPASTYLSEPYWPALVYLTTYVFLRFGHSHIRLSLGPILDRILVTPAVHIVHHARDVPNVNYGNAFSLWDVAFGTFHAHNADDAVNPGISEFGDDHYRNIVQLLFEPCVDAVRLLRLWPSMLRRAIAVR